MKPPMGLIAAACLFAAPAVAQAPPAAPAEPTYAYAGESHFGLFVSTDGKQTFKETDEVPNQAGQQYGWFVKLNTNRPTAHVREEIKLPTPANSWNAGGPLPPGMTVAADRASAVFERDIPVLGGVVFNVWSVAQGDPVGDYVIRLTVEGQVRQFNFAIR